MLKKGMFACLFYIFSSAIFALPTVIKVYQRCDVDVPLKNGYVLVTNMKEQFFMPTDDDGNFILDDAHNGESVMAYLANADEVIFPGCRSDIVSTQIGKVVLHGLCPSRNC